MQAKKKLDRMQAWRSILGKHDFHAILARTDDLDGNSAEDAWLYRGKALEGLCRFDEAATAYAGGLKCFPDSMPLHLALGQLEIQRGRPKHALKLLRRGCELEPNNLNCYTARLNLESLDPDGPEAARMLVRALDERKSEASRARALFFLGQINVEAKRDRIGFAYYRAGNALAAKPIDPSRREYSLPRHLLTLSRADFETANPAVPECKVIVVAGLPRSGKTMLESMLAEHAAIFPAGEYAGLRRALAKLDKKRLLEGVRKQASEGRSPFAKAYAKHPLAGVGAGWLVDSSPANLTRLGYFGMVHPDTPVVLCRRRAPDLGVSLYFKKFKTGHGYTYDLQSIGRAIALTERLIDHWRAVLPNPVLVVDYEDLVSDPEGTRTALFAHLGLEVPARIERKSSEQDWRVFPGRSPGPGAPISPALIGFSDRFEGELAPMISAYREMKTALPNATRPGPG
ncbi:MAG: sulfotransferase [Wenzhouxiangella sp.]|jgi:tetratricopeptide (TPR) repeat protein|nr:sulfotransferase [Wenzhouxiangella sp.]